MRVFRVLAVLTLLSGSAPLLAQPPQPAQQNEFVPMKDVPPQEQLPAPTLVAAAYGFAWIAILGYLWTVARRVRKVEADLAALERGPR